MSLMLSSTELAQVEAASTVLLSPLDYERVADWRRASRRALERLLQADISGSLLPLAGEPYAESEPELRPAAVAYETYFARLDTGLQVTRREKGLTVFSVHDIYDWAAYRTTEIFADWNVPFRLFDSIAMACDLAPDLPAASLHFYHDREQGPRFGERGLALLRLLLPSFTAGVETLVRTQAARTALAALLDRSGEALLLFDRAGRRLHETPAVDRLLGPEPQPERARLRRAADALARALAGLRRLGPHREPQLLAPLAVVRTARGPYRLAASLLDADRHDPRHPFGPEAGILVTLTARAASEPVTDVVVQERYRLTARETAVARLLAERRSAADVAHALGVSRHTARRHTEHVYEKLGVHSRAQLSAKLHGDRPT